MRLLAYFVQRLHRDAAEDVGETALIMIMAAMAVDHIKWYKFCSTIRGKEQRKNIEEDPPLIYCDRNQSVRKQK